MKPFDPKSARLVPFEPHHAAGVPEVVRDACIEYGFTWNDSHYFDDLHHVNKHYHDRGGMFWVLLDGEHVIGTVGVSRHADECELHRLYLLRGYRGHRFGQRLLDVALDWTREQTLNRMVAWSDVKLTHAHALYRANGFVQRGERIADDPDLSREYGFFKDLA